MLHGSANIYLDCFAMQEFKGFSATILKRQVDYVFGGYIQPVVKNLKIIGKILLWPTEV